MRPAFCIWQAFRLYKYQVTVLEETLIKMNQEKLVSSMLSVVISHVIGNIPERSFPSAVGGFGGALIFAFSAFEQFIQIYLDKRHTLRGFEFFFLIIG